jgi:hypothetical protein
VHPLSIDYAQKFICFLAIKNRDLGKEIFKLLKSIIKGKEGKVFFDKTFL